jgi:hypothetical protein
MIWVLSKKRSRPTVKAHNFGPHENFGPLFSEGLAIIEMCPAGKRRE